MLVYSFFWSSKVNMFRHSSISPVNIPTSSHQVLFRTYEEVVCLLFLHAQFWHGLRKFVDAEQVARQCLENPVSRSISVFVTRFLCGWSQQHNSTQAKGSTGWSNCRRQSQCQWNATWANCEWGCLLARIVPGCDSKTLADTSTTAWYVSCIVWTAASSIPTI